MIDSRVLPRAVAGWLAVSLITVALTACGSAVHPSVHPTPERERAAAGRQGPPSPRCTPSALNRSAVLPGTTLSVSPLPETRVAAPTAQVSLLGVPRRLISAITVSGSRTGAHAGRLLGYSQGDGASFVPSRPFARGERVTVRGSLQLAAGRQAFAYAFTVAHEDPLPDRTSRYSQTPKPTGLQNLHSLPDLHPPLLHVRKPAAPGVAPGDIFLAAYASANGPGGPLIFTDTGQLVWFKQLPAKVSAANLQVQSLDGRPVLSWWQGYVLPQGFGEGQEVIASSSYRQLAVVKAANGLHADLHDFRITAQGTGLLTAFDPVYCDLSSVGGPRDGAISDGVFQEIDLKTGLVRREWHALDHVAIADAHPKPIPSRSRKAFPFDFFHINTVDPRSDGRTTISARNTWAVYELGARTGQVLRRIGGRQSTVKLGLGTATAWQHDALTLPNGELTIFDNGAEPKVHQQSRGIRERIDPRTNSVKLIGQYVHSPPLSAGTQGNLQTLPNGDALIGWGAEPYVSEYSPSGRELFDASLAAPDQSYRAFRFPWTGQPTSRPTLRVVSRAGGGQGDRRRVGYVSWNGATQVSGWRLLGGPTARQLSQLSSATKGGFETALPIPESGPWFEAQALDASGSVIASSVPVESR